MPVKKALVREGRAKKAQTRRAPSLLYHLLRFFLVIVPLGLICFELLARLLELRLLFGRKNGEHLLMKLELLAHQLCLKRSHLSELLRSQSFVERTALICIVKLTTLCLDLLHQRTGCLSAALAKLFHLCFLGISQIQIAENSPCIPRSRPPQPRPCP